MTFQKIGIYFNSTFEEKTLPIIKLTRSKNKNIGTVTFLFIKPTLFSISSFSINSMTIFWKTKNLKTKNLTLFFKDGKPFFLQAIFILKNSQEWFTLLQFLSSYSIENQFIFFY